ncbi:MULTISPECIES: aminotransferase-like domain-containing protein [Burkholderia]|uniref:aminotransferase-like domain-containing protein n=1 Tax=Burkholderia TaxID=32008 RepID=UPI001F1A6F8C|nr:MULTISPECIES: PLP-dependent aminotransferase family protein [Burkholderia]
MKDQDNNPYNPNRPAGTVKPPWLVAIEISRGPRYLAIANGVKAALVNGTLKVGDRLPPQRELARLLQLNLGTVTRAFDELRSMGLIQGTVGRGTYLTLPASTDSPASLWDHSQPQGFIDLSHNFPEHAPGMAGAHALLGTQLRVEDAARLLATQVDAGHAAHRAAAARWLDSRGVPAMADHLVVTCGAQHGLLLALGALTRPGDIVLTEELTYYGLKSAAAMMGRSLVGVRMDAEGLLPEALDTACQRSGAKVLFCCPTLHNPTTATMSAARRREIVEVCRRRDLLIVEDDVYGWMPEEALPCLAILAPERTTYVTGLSKLVGPGLRIGFVVTPPQHVHALGVALRATTLMASPLNAAMATSVLESGEMTHIVETIREETRARQALVAASLPASAIVTRPGAFYFGLRTGNHQTGQGFARAAEAAGIGVTPYDLFEATPLTGSTLVRVCHNAAPDRDSLRRALAGLARMLDQPVAAPPFRQGI